MNAPQLRTIVLRALPLDEDADRAAREWEHALSVFESRIPELHSPVVGLCTVRARGPARYYGSETRAALAWIEAAIEQGFTQASIGIGDNCFTAEQAAYVDTSAPGLQVPHPAVRIVESERTTQFLAALPISAAAPAELAVVLTGLGIRTLGALGALPEAAVHERFGAPGINAYLLATGRIPRSRTAVGIPRAHGEYRSTLDLDAPLDDSEQIAFASRAHTEGFLETLARQDLICTELRVELVDDEHALHARVWAHPTRFTATDITSRIRWQAEELPRSSDRGGAGITEVTLVATRVSRAADHEPGLWNTSPDERVHHHLTRIQSVLGYAGVGTGRVTGGRLSADRQQLLPWASTAALPREGAADLPWPGHITATAPSMVFAEHDAPGIELLDAQHRPVLIDEEDFLSADPARCTALLASGRSSATVIAWSKPWPLRECWWQSSPSAVAQHRLQLLLDDGSAWLVRYQQVSATWKAEGRYD